jgi:hypothetical protein
MSLFCDREGVPGGKSDLDVKDFVTKRTDGSPVPTGKPADEKPAAPKAEAEPAPVPKFKPANKPERSKKFAPHSDAPHAPKPPRPGSSAPHARQDGPAKSGKPSFKPGPGGRKLSGKFRKP